MKQYYISQAVLTKVLPCTDTKPTRIKAFCSRGSIVVSYHADVLETDREAHERAFKALIAKFRAEDKDRPKETKNPWAREYIMGGMPNSSSECFVFVFVD
jgi:hypothetical protein